MLQHLNSDEENDTTENFGMALLSILHLVHGGLSSEQSESESTLAPRKGEETWRQKLESAATDLNGPGGWSGTSCRALSRSLSPLLPLPPSLYSLSSSISRSLPKSPPPPTPPLHPSVPPSPTLRVRDRVTGAAGHKQHILAP